MKTCKACDVAKPLDDFYAQANVVDGRMGKCKECWKQHVKEARHTNPRVREYDRVRAKQPHRVALASRITKAWRNSERMKAHNAAARARLEPPSLCEGCGLDKKLEKHHPDYSKPLLVVWLCKPCHAIADKIRRRLEAS